MTIESVLVVDDEPDLRIIARIALESVGGWRTTLVASGPEALEHARRDSPDVILLDVMMPSMDGPSTLAQLRADPQTADIPVIFLTAKVQGVEVERFLALGVAGVLRKPFDPMKLADEVRRIVESR